MWIGGGVVDGDTDPVPARMGLLHKRGNLIRISHVRLKGNGLSTLIHNFPGDLLHPFDLSAGQDHLGSCF